MTGLSLIFAPPSPYRSPAAVAGPSTPCCAGGCRPPSAATT